jgi:hypothetical protein
MIMKKKGKEGTQRGKTTRGGPGELLPLLLSLSLSLPLSLSLASSLAYVMRS